MFSLLSNIGFLNPWILAGMIFLPALWFLLRLTPPAPRLIRFPAARFLAGLQPDDHTSSQTPWWILLLRMAIAALVIIALARPIMNQADMIQGHGPIRIVIDNGWAAAQNWDKQIGFAAETIARASREKREIYILTTAPEPGQDNPLQHGPMAQGQADAVLRALNPYPWPANYEAAASLIEGTTDRDTIVSFFLSHGLQDEKPDRLIRLLQNQGSLHFLEPENDSLPVLLRLHPQTGADLKARISLSKQASQNTSFSVQALSANGHILDTQTIKVSRGDKRLDATFDLPINLRQKTKQIRLTGKQGAGTVILLDDTQTRRTVGIVSSTNIDDSPPLIEEHYYLHRALEPYADLITDTVNDLLDKKPAAMILPDIGGLPADELNRLETWVREGGLLLRFAGPNMTQGETFLTPAPLRKGGRSLDGALTWDDPPQLAPFPDTSPYFGLPIPQDLSIHRQILAEPVPGLDDMTWATLEDGTPLITARNMEKGLLVLIHTTATPQWSDFALSGLFVQVLQRTINLAGHNNLHQSTTAALQPLLILDGFGRLHQPEGSTQPIAGDLFGETKPSSKHPPGLYGRLGYQNSLNLGDHINTLKTFDNLPAGINRNYYDGKKETELMPYLLYVALLLFMLDWTIMLLIQSSFYKRFFRYATASFIIAFLILSYPTIAQANKAADAIQYASELHLAYMKTGSLQVDTTTKTGLKNLAAVLTRRTSVEPAGIVGLNPTDELSFFPVIYWPITPNLQPLSTEALHNIQSYLDHGGTILFDTRDHQSTPRNTNFGGNHAAVLRSVTSGLNIPPLTPTPDNHVLTRSFYLMKEFPGRYSGGTLWVEENSAGGRDGVSSILVGNHDWASAWAAGDNSAVPLSGGPQQQEMALRFGVNLIMYALTGNYKADQVHVPHILERLGQ